MMKSIEVVAAVIHKGDKIFATQRGYGEWKDWWEFPGGKIEAGESPEAALTREIREELNAEIRIDRYLATVDWDYPKFHLTLHCYVCSLQTGAMHLNEHEAACWLRADELHRVQWLPADEGLLPLIEKQMKQSSSPMKQNKPAMRADFVGSFLRPESVKKARVQAAAGEAGAPGRRP